MGRGGAFFYQDTVSIISPTVQLLSIATQVFNSFQQVKERRQQQTAPWRRNPNSGVDNLSKGTGVQGLLGPTRFFFVDEIMMRNSSEGLDSNPGGHCSFDSNSASS